jgi:hypothetical protein
LSTPAGPFIPESPAAPEPDAVFNSPKTDKILCAVKSWNPTEGANGATGAAAVELFKSSVDEVLVRDIGLEVIFSGLEVIGF